MLFISILANCKISPVFEKNRTLVHAMSMLGDLVRVATATKFAFLLYLHTLLLNSERIHNVQMQRTIVKGELPTLLAPS